MHLLEIAINILIIDIGSSMSINEKTEDYVDDFLGHVGYFRKGMRKIMLEKR